MFEKLYQHNFSKNTKTVSISLSFENIFKKAFKLNKKKSNFSLHELSEAEIIMEEIFEEFWPDEEQDIEDLTLNFANIELEFEQIFYFYWK